MSVTANVTTPAVPAETRWSRIRWHKLAPYLFISPFFIIFAIFGLFPIVYSGFIGLNNYITLLKDPDFLNALRNTALLTLISGPVTIGGGLVLAVILNNRLIRFRS